MRTAFLAIWLINSLSSSGYGDGGKPSIAAPVNLEQRVLADMKHMDKTLRASAETQAIQALANDFLTVATTDQEIIRLKSEMGSAWSLYVRVLNENSSRLYREKKTIPERVEVEAESKAKYDSLTRDLKRRYEFIFEAGRLRDAKYILGSVQLRKGNEPAYPFVITVSKGGRFWKIEDRDPTGGYLFGFKRVEVDGQVAHLKLGHPDANNIVSRTLGLIYAPDQYSGYFYDEHFYVNHQWIRSDRRSVALPNYLVKYNYGIKQTDDTDRAIVVAYVSMGPEFNHLPALIDGKVYRLMEEPVKMAPAGEED